MLFKCLGQKHADVRGYFLGDSVFVAEMTEAFRVVRKVEADIKTGLDSEEFISVLAQGLDTAEVDSFTEHELNVN